MRACCACCAESVLPTARVAASKVVALNALAAAAAAAVDAKLKAPRRDCVSSSVKHSQKQVGRDHVSVCGSVRECVPLLTMQEHAWMTPVAFCSLRCAAAPAHHTAKLQALRRDCASSFVKHRQVKPTGIMSVYGGGHVQGRVCTATGATLPGKVVRAWCFPNGLLQGHVRPDLAEGGVA